eukprot:m.190464 g.190464  ORF g.190464 m.190464 type:complete len:223 (+) comp39433_c1_seq4:1830-2498(+)
MGFLYHTSREAIRYENGPAIIRLWKYWLAPFIGGGKHQYANETANMLANLCCDWPDDIVKIHTFCRTINTCGKLGHGKPIDQLVENYNLIIKNGVRNAGANLSKDHVRLVSMVAFTLMKACSKVDSVAMTTTGASHTTRSAEKDIQAMIKILSQNEYATEQKQRRFEIFNFTDPRRSGLRKNEEKSWLKKFLMSSKEALPDSDVECEGYERRVVDYDDLASF